MKILIIDSNTLIRRSMIRYLQLHQLFDKVIEAGSMDEAEMALESNKIAVLLFDLKSLDGFESDVDKYFQKILTKPMVIFYSNEGIQQHLSSNNEEDIHFIFDKSMQLTVVKNLLLRLTEINKMVHVNSYNKGYPDRILSSYTSA